MAKCWDRDDVDKLLMMKSLKLQFEKQNSIKIC